MKIQAPVFGRLMDVVEILGYNTSSTGERIVEASMGPFTIITTLADLVIVGAEVA